jgi:D-glycero-alpha-D-manno-heptose-7-phosphate kinase
MIVTKTPLRMSFFGGGTDYPEFFNRLHGAVFGMAINRYAYITIRSLHDFFKDRYKLVYSRTEVTGSVEEIQHPAIRACLRYLQFANPLELHHIADWPARTGLGSSSSFTVGLLKALHAFHGRELPHHELARQAIDVERNVIRERVGFQDQVWAAYGGVGVIKFMPEDRFAYEAVPVSRDVERRFLDHALLFYLDIARYAHDVLDEQIEKTKARSNDAILKDMLALVPEGKDAFLAADFERFGTLLHDNWELKKQLSSRIANTTILDAYERARSLGAYGGKLLGAGGGGFMLFIAPPESHQRIIEGLRPLKPAPFRPADAGSQLIYHEEQ